MITLRPATPGDTTSLAALAVQTFNETFPGLYAPQDLQAHMQTYSSPEYFARRLKTDSILLAMDGGEMIGYAKFGAVGLPVRHAPDAAEIHRLYIRNSHQGKAIGRLLMEAMLDQLKTVPALYLGVWENNLRAQRFYAEYGFAPVGEYLYFVGSHADREYVLRKENA